MTTSKPQFGGEKVKLGDVLAETFSGEWGNQEGDRLIPVLRTSNFNEDRSFDYSTPALRSISEKKIESKRLFRGDVVLEKSGGTPKRPVGIIAYYDSDNLALCSNFNQVLRFDGSRIDPRFAFHQLRWLWKQNAFGRFTRKTTGLQNLQMKKFVDLGMRLPKIPQQQRIAKQLDYVGRMISGIELQIEKLDQLVKSRFVEMFGDPCLTDRSLLPQKPLHSFCELKIGPFGSLLHKEDYVSGGFPVVNPSHIVDGCIRTDSDLTINAAKYREMESYQLFKGDVVLGRRGEIGRCAVVDEEGLLCGTGSMILRPEPSLCRSDYLQRVISFPSFAAALEKEAVGVTMKNLNVKIIGSAVVSLPPLSLQEEFADFVAQVDKSGFA